MITVMIEDSHFLSALMKTGSDFHTDITFMSDYSDDAARYEEELSLQQQSNHNNSKEQHNITGLMVFSKGYKRM